MKVLIPADLNKDEFNWTDEPVIGLTLLTAEHDSLKNPIEAQEYYLVGKHKESGMLAIIHVPDYDPNTQTESK